MTLPVASMAKSAKLMQLGVSGLKARLRAPTMNLDVSATPPLGTSAPEVQPLEVSETIRAKRSLLEPEATVVKTPAPKRAPDEASRSVEETARMKHTFVEETPPAEVTARVKHTFVEETRSVDVASLLDDAPPPPVDIFETLPPTRMQTIPPPSRKATFLPLGGPDANPTPPAARASMAPSEPKSRAHTVALDVAPFVESTTMKLDDEVKETMRAPRPSTMPPVRHATLLAVSGPDALAPSRPSYAAPVALPLHTSGDAFVDVPTQPGIVAPPPTPTPWTPPTDARPLAPSAPPAPTAPMSAETRTTLWIAVAVVVAVVFVLVVAVSSATR